MSKFIPKLVNEDKGTFILIDNPFSAEEGIKYAAEHNHNIKFTCGNYTCAVELLYYIQREGYQLEITIAKGIEIEDIETEEEIPAE